jgi:hypothetical protein
VKGGDRSNYLGGLCGGNNRCTISNCYATGSVAGGDQLDGDVAGGLGGLCGGNLEGSISNSYATGSITGGVYSSSLGGLCGWNAGTISNCYAIGSVTGGDGFDYLGGLCGENLLGGMTSDCYFLDIAGPDNGIGTPLTDAQMKLQESYVSWDFTTPVWKMVRENEDYPRLNWQEEIVGDFKGLWGVNSVDFAYFASRWLEDDCDASNNCGGADIDTSGMVGIDDAVILAGNWLKGTE